MKVNDLHSVVQGIDPRGIRKPDKSADKLPNPTQESADGDSLDVTLSNHLSARSAATAAEASDETSALSPSRVAEIRDRVQSGFYNSPAVLADTATRLLSFYAQ